MKKTLIVLLTLTLLLCFVSCNDDTESSSLDDTVQTSSNASESTSANSSQTETTDTLGKTEVMTFQAKVVEVLENSLLLYSDDEDRPNEQNDYYVNLPEGESAEEFAEGDTVRVRYSGTISDTVPCAVQGVLSIPHIVQKTTTIEFEAVITEIYEDSYVIKGTTEGYEREFTVTKPIERLELGDKVAVKYSFRGAYSQNNPAEIDESASVTNLNPDPPEPEVFIARIDDTTDNERMFVIYGQSWYGAVDARTTEGDFWSYEVGDYVEITYKKINRGILPEFGISEAIVPMEIRPLTEEEIFELGKDSILIGTYLGPAVYEKHLADGEYIDVPSKEVIIVEDSSTGQQYHIVHTLFEDIPTLSVGDRVRVVYDGIICYDWLIPYATKIDKIDTDGNIIE